MLKDTRGQALVVSALLAPLFFILDEQRRNVNRAGMYAYAEDSTQIDAAFNQPGCQVHPAPFEIEGFLSSHGLKGGVF